MIRSVTVINHLGDSLKMRLSAPQDTGLNIVNIEGLGPSRATINSTELATIDGALFSSSRSTSRNIVIAVKLMFSPTVEASRLKTYKYFPVKQRITLLIETDQRLAEVSGYVESNEPVIFSKEEYTQISIVCPDPYFYEESTAETVFLGVQPMFEFPFSNDSLTENELQFGDIRLDTRAVLNYQGDVETGILITVHAIGSASGVTLYNTITRESIMIDTDKIQKITGEAFGTGDDIVISTIKGNKYAQLLRRGVYTNIISAINKDADWFQLSNGGNEFAFSATTGENKLVVTFSYRNAYGGI